MTRNSWDFTQMCGVAVDRFTDLLLVKLFEVLSPLIQWSSVLETLLVHWQGIESWKLGFWYAFCCRLDYDNIHILSVLYKFCTQFVYQCMDLSLLFSALFDLSSVACVKYNLLASSCAIISIIEIPIIHSWMQLWNIRRILQQALN